MSYFIKQISDKDCGITALKIMLANIYHRKDFLFYPEVDYTSGASLKDLVLIAKKEGVDLSVYRLVNKDEIKKLKRKECILILKDYKTLHAVYLKKVKRNGVIVADPKRGIIYLSYDELFSLWNGEVMEAIKTSGSKFKFKDKKIVPFKYSFVIFVLQILSYSFFISGLYFINSKISFLIPLILFLCFVLSSILSNIIIGLFMKKIDIKLFKNIYQTKGNLKDKYLKIVKLKSLLFKNPLEILSSLLLIFFSIFILGINNYLTLFAISFLFIIEIFFHLFINKYFIYKKNNLERYEYDLFNSNEENMLTNFNRLNDEVYKFVNLNNLKKYFLIFTMIVLSMILSSFDGSISLNFVLFHTFAFSYIISNFEKILNYKNNEEELNYYKSYYFFASNNY